jgi:ElaB/YqjD/DUF883 family membrane-anchored ribosome-binding protein
MVDESPEVIKSQMEQTRQDLVEKIETLEQQVTQTVKEATSAVSSTVDTVKEVVSNTSDAVQSTADSVKDVVSNTKDAVQSAVDSVVGALDFPGHVQRSPWLMFGGAVATGFALGKVLAPPQTSSISASADFNRLSAVSADSGRSSSESTSKQPEQPSKSVFSAPLSALGSMFEKPLEIAEGMAVSAFFSLLQNVVREAIPADWKHQVLGVVDDLNKQLGGLPLTDWNGHQALDKGDRDHAERNGPKVAGSVGSTDWQG